MTIGIRLPLWSSLSSCLFFFSLTIIVPVLIIPGIKVYIPILEGSVHPEIGDVGSMRILTRKGSGKIILSYYWVTSNNLFPPLYFSYNFCAMIDHDFEHLFSDRSSKI